MPLLRRIGPLPSAARQVLIVAIFLGFGLAGAAMPAAAVTAPELHTDSANPSGGYYRLTWDWPDQQNQRFQLQESVSRDFSDPQTIYTGPDRATVISGRSDGGFFYRVRRNPDDAEPGPWSEVVEVRVEHHSLERAFLFFGIGAVVFVATLALVVGGNLKARKREHA